MASISKRPDSKYWRACWTSPDGRRLKRSTKTADKKLAEKLARTFEEESNKRRTAKQARDILTGIYQDLSGHALPTCTTRAYLSRFVQQKKPEASPATVEFYASVERRFLKWLGPKADKDIAEITKDDLMGFRDHAATTAGPRTTNNNLKAIKAFFAGALKDGFLSEDPSRLVNRVMDKAEPNRRPFTLEELQRIIATADTEWKSMVRCGLYTGLRLGDVASLTWDHIDLVKGEIRIRTQKTGRIQILPLPPALRKNLEVAKAAPGRPIHPAAFAVMQRGSAGEKAGRSGVLSKAFARILAKAGLRTNQEEVDPGHARIKFELSFHSLRHSTTSLLKNAGVSQSVVMGYVGHDSESVSSGYTHVGLDALSAAAETLPEI